MIGFENSQLVPLGEIAQVSGARLRRQSVLSYGLKVGWHSSRTRVFYSTSFHVPFLFWVGEIESSRARFLEFKFSSIHLIERLSVSVLVLVYSVNCFD